ncbi:hypothetical protein Pfo_011486 [Paulownia fortunei]|nr:hypothetical protein Pfo_011486 [Paulownia fortunei]
MKSYETISIFLPPPQQECPTKTKVPNIEAKLGLRNHIHRPFTIRSHRLLWHDEIIWSSSSGIIRARQNAKQRRTQIPTLSS